MVKVTLNGRHEARRVTIDPSIANEDLAVLEDLIAAAINDAVHRAERAQQEKMATLTAGPRPSCRLQVAVLTMSHC